MSSVSLRVASAGTEKKRLIAYICSRLNRAAPFLQGAGE
jgi:hypothetical protein